MTTETTTPQEWTAETIWQAENLPAAWLPNLEVMIPSAALLRGAAMGQVGADHFQSEFIDAFRRETSWERLDWPTLPASTEEADAIRRGQVVCPNCAGSRTLISRLKGLTTGIVVTEGGFRCPCWRAWMFQRLWAEIETTRRGSHVPVSKSWSQAQSRS